MAKTRYINSKFWSDTWIRKLNPLDRYLFLYFISNEHINVSGIYELPIETMAFESGLEKEELLNSMLPRLKPKVLFKDGWVIIPNFPKNQNLQSNDLVKGIEREFEAAPKWVQDMASEVNWGEGLGRVGGGSREGLGTIPHTKTKTKTLLRPSGSISKEMSHTEKEEGPGLLTFEEFMESQGFRRDSLVDSENNTAVWWENQDGIKLRKGEVTTLQGAYRRSQGHMAVRSAPPETIQTDKFLEAYREAVKKRYGREPVLDGKAKMIVRKGLIEKYPKEQVNAFVKWFLDNEKIEKKWKFNVQSLASTNFMNEFLSV